MLQLLRTVAFLKPIQIRYQLWYRVKRLWPNKKYNADVNQVSSLEWKQHIKSYSSYKKQTFKFLNLSKTFENEIDWNFADHGKLWLYNLTYFDYLHQEQIATNEALLLMQSFAKDYNIYKDGKEPYPTSLRIINWVKYLSENQIKDERLNSVLREDLSRLNENLEYHILANHLLENAFALLFGAYYFGDDKVYKKAAALLKRQLEEQILEDGAHYELSPMYHQIILNRVLDAIQLVKFNNWKGEGLVKHLMSVAEKMLGWLGEMTFSDGSIPLVNDAATGIAPTTKQLMDYSQWLNVKSKTKELSESGYRSFRSPHFEMVADVGNLRPTYQPGHAHADTLQFVLHIGGRPFIVDSGTATYENNDRRAFERSTAAHNTVTINGKNSSEVWSSFRVGRRAVVSILRDEPTYLKASHDGYRHLGCIHVRSFSIKDRMIELEDKIKGDYSQGIAYLHFHPNVEVEQKSMADYSIDGAQITVKGAKNTELKKYLWSDQFNITSEAAVLEIHFESTVKTFIKIA